MYLLYILLYYIYYTVYYIFVIYCNFKTVLVRYTNEELGFYLDKTRA